VAPKIFHTIGKAFCTQFAADRVLAISIGNGDLVTADAPTFLSRQTRQLFCHEDGAAEPATSFYETFSDPTET
jgi:hypothetical protein